MPPTGTGARNGAKGSQRGGSKQAAEAREQMLAQLTPVVAATGYDLEDVSVTAAGRRNLVRIVVDRDGGVDLDAVAEISRVVSESLDAQGDAFFAGAYVLEVSSPGVDRPLTEPRHWRRAVGRLVQVPVAGAPVTGRVCAADDAGVTLEVGSARREIAWSDLGPGRVQVEFNRKGAAAHPDDTDGTDEDDDLDDTEDLGDTEDSDDIDEDEED